MKRSRVGSGGSFCCLGFLRFLVSIKIFFSSSGSATLAFFLFFASSSNEAFGGIVTFPGVGTAGVACFTDGAGRATVVAVVVCVVFAVVSIWGDAKLEVCVQGKKGNGTKRKKKKRGQFSEEKKKQKERKLKKESKRKKKTTFVGLARALLSPGDGRITGDSASLISSICNSHIFL